MREKKRLINSVECIAMGHLRASQQKCWWQQSMWLNFKVDSSQIHSFIESKREIDSIVFRTDSSHTLFSPLQMCQIHWRGKSSKLHRWKQLALIEYDLFCHVYLKLQNKYLANECRLGNGENANENVNKMWIVNIQTSKRLCCYPAIPNTMYVDIRESTTNGIQSNGNHCWYTINEIS